MKKTIQTCIFLDEFWGSIKTFVVNYNFDKNCWIIEKEVTIDTATRIANEIKKKYYDKKSWVISWTNKKMEVRFINEMEHI